MLSGRVAFPSDRALKKTADQTASKTARQSKTGRRARHHPVRNRVPRRNVALRPGAPRILPAAYCTLNAGEVVTMPLTVQFGVSVAPLNVSDDGGVVPD